MTRHLSSFRVSTCILCTALAVMVLSASGARAAGPRWDPAWQHLPPHPVPQWFRDAKFGIYFHWGVYSVPAFGNEWYSRNMYVKGSREYQHHLATYGPLDKFGYKDFIPMFKARQFDPDAWVDLFVRAGAKFVGPVAEHADGFAMWNSRVSPYNAAQMGPKRDVVGLLAAAVRKRGLKFVCTLHHQWLWGWYPTWDKSVDAGNPKYADLYGPKTVPGAWHNNPKPTPYFCQRWLDKVKEVVDNYHPDLLYFDSRMSIIAEKYRLEMVRHVYQVAQQRGQQVVLTYKGRDLPVGAGVIDLERGRMNHLTRFAWMTDTPIDTRSWCHISNPAYRSAEWIVHTLVDIVSKNGCLLLDVAPTANGVIPTEQVNRLLAVGKWLQLNGQAIYGSRPWKVFGEGPTKFSGGSFNEGKIGAFTPQDIRFTTHDGKLYAIAMAWPKDKRLAIHALGKIAGLLQGDIETVRLLGYDKPLTFRRAKDALTINLPAQPPCDFASVFQIVTGK